MNTERGRSENDEGFLFLVVEGAYTSPTVNGQKYVHTAKAASAEDACRRVEQAIRGRGEGEGRKLLDEGLVLTVVEWGAVDTFNVRDEPQVKRA